MSSPEPKEPDQAEASETPRPRKPEPNAAPPRAQKPHRPAEDDADDDGPGIFDTQRSSPRTPRAGGAGGAGGSSKITFDVVDSVGRLTTQVLDTAEGRPAVGMRVELARLVPQPGGKTTGREPLADVRTGEAGRTPRPLLEGDALLAGQYELRFHVGDYYATINHPHAWRFLDEVPVVFRVDDTSAAYHVPLLVSPWSYSTHRGS